MRALEKRVTIYDIAEKLGVSTTTVNRALTGKGRIKPETRERVVETARRMGFTPNANARCLARKRIRIAVIAFSSFAEFHSAFLKGAQDAGDELRDFNVEIRCYGYETGPTDTREAAEYLEATLKEIMTEGFDGVLALAQDSPGFAKLKLRGVRVAAAVNDLDPSLRAFCIRYNAYTAGRIAAEILYRYLPEGQRRVAVASGFTGAGCIHDEIVSGFRAQAREMPLDIRRICYNRDDAALAYQETLRLLRDEPELNGIYVNSFNYSGVLRALRETGRAGRVTLVTSDICPELSACIREGIVSASIFQNQYEQGRQGVKALYRNIADNAGIDDMLLIDPQIIMRSNLELFA